MSDDRSTNGNQTYPQPDADQHQRLEIITNDLIANDLAAGAPPSSSSKGPVRGGQWIGGSPEPSTFYAEANLIDLEDKVMRRHAELTETRTGSGAAVYGKDFPASSWSNDPAGLEPPLGYSVNDLNDNQLANNPNILLAQAAQSVAEPTPLPDPIVSPAVDAVMRRFVRRI